VSGASTTWEVDGTAVDGLVSSLPPREPAAEWQAELYIAPRERPISAVDRYLALREFLTYADRADYGRRLDGEAWYREELPQDASIDSLAVPIAPQSVDFDGVYEGIWGLVTGGEDPNRRGPPYRLTVEVVVLADRGAYADRAALESALKDSGL